MELVVRALRCPPPDQPQAINARFGANGGRIGRSNTCSLPLPSPDRYISREHLEIRCRDGRYSLKVISKVNGCSVNDNAVPPGAAVELSNGDRIQLGDYLLVAELQGASAAAPAAPAIRDPLAAFGHSAGARADSLDMMASLAPPPAAGVARDSQFGTSPNWAKPPTPEARRAPPVAPLAQPLEADPAAGDLSRMLDAPPSASPRPRAASADAAAHRVSVPAGNDYGASALDAFLGTDRPAAAVPMSDQAQGLFRQQDVNLAMPAQGNNTLPEPFDDDIFAALDKDFGPARSAPAPAPAPAPLAPVRAAAPPADIDPLDIDLMADVAAPARTHVIAPPRAAPEPAVAPKAPPVAAGGAGVDGTAALAVLAQALELEPGDLDASNPMETIRIVGELLNLTVNGLYQMLQMRAELKNELRIEDRTMIASRENNPLKHSESARDALRYLVDVRQHGNKLFLPPVKAIGDAVNDVCAHEMAVMAGTRAALLAALKMFAPDTVEKRIKKSGALDSVVPALHRAKLWESFLAMYGELEKEAEDHFDRLLNQEFARAYAEQGKKLRRKK
ncbi:type VI secretion system-associated FHA domain protein TagH [Scleromatobacter humisilvae]|uniref:Type VI secretion system-associated FHA domain protein TagH n=1 Tax=Scleromatobacter humisilvae TaxID=2897159 RepID=A0A9X1YP14_9BURK|nr:type VI secretion system-associated FHA domain protein TagH [Scleromatobacter humisilvae]MCK9689723.1 type VI secretion system-associated FHA domain protein TagH [Scleromatobacter humisilvae]